MVPRPPPRTSTSIVVCVAVTLFASTPSWAASGASIAALALANVGKGACSTTSLGGSDYGTSCTGNDGSPEYWCADFALWAWASSGVTNVSGLDAAAGSFYTYGQNNGTLSDTPAVGDAVVFDYSGGGVADHVAIVTQVNADGTIETVSGDWNGSGSTEAGFSSTSSVVLNSPAYAGTVGTAPSDMGMTISGFVAPVGLGFDYGAEFVSQSFPFATTAITMTSGQTVASYIELKNIGTKSWDASTRLGTTQPRDRASMFADDTWLATNRPAGVSGSVAPGDSYEFQFDLHAPATAGTYFEYFGVVEEGVAWFGDPGQGGPVDGDLEVQIVVVEGPAAADAGVGDAGEGASEDAGSGNAERTAQAEDAGSAPNAASTGGATESAGGSTGGGCAVTATRQTSDATGVIALVIGAIATRRRRRH